MQRDYQERSIDLTHKCRLNGIMRMPVKLTPNDYLEMSRSNSQTSDGGQSAGQWSLPCYRNMSFDSDGKCKCCLKHFSSMYQSHHKPDHDLSRTKSAPAPSQSLNMGSGECYQFHGMMYAPYVSDDSLNQDNYPMYNQEYYECNETLTINKTSPSLHNKSPLSQDEPYTKRSKFEYTNASFEVDPDDVSVYLPKHNNPTLKRQDHCPLEESKLEEERFGDIGL